MISSVRQLDRLLQQLLVVVGRPNVKTSGKAHFCTASQYRPQLLQRQPAPPGSRCSVRASSTNANVRLRVRLRHKSGRVALPDVPLIRRLFATAASRSANVPRTANSVSLSSART
jgi:hypothetical protein